MAHAQYLMVQTSNLDAKSRPRWKKKNCENINTEILQELLKGRKMLYNLKYLDYKNVQMTNKIWKSTGGVLVVSGEVHSGHRRVLLIIQKLQY